jgi:hypothetical protein
MMNRQDICGRVSEPASASKSLAGLDGKLADQDSTWRPLVEELEDRPLALCDSRTVALDDLVAADRVLPHTVGEIYFLQYDASQRWYGKCLLFPQEVLTVLRYWLEKQRTSEPLLFLAYDTHSRPGAARCKPSSP